MNNILFLHSEVNDPYAIYEIMRAQHPVYWDKTIAAWGIYSYNECKAILENSLAHIPAVNPGNQDGLGEYALQIEAGLTRLHNGRQHAVSRQVAMLLLENMFVVGIEQVMNGCIRGRHEIDWVDAIGKRLPISFLLKSFAFNANDSALIAGNISQLARLMLPGKSAEEVIALNNLADQLYPMVEKRVLVSGFFERIKTAVKETHAISNGELVSLCVSNLIGLFIQSYDAGRGLLSNSLLQLLRNPFPVKPEAGNDSFFTKCVIETLRFDPPVHHTRRIAVSDFQLGDKKISKGEHLVVFVAAANRDPVHFNNPAQYDIDRSNNAEYLSFGAGVHRCPANKFSIGLTAAALSYLFEKYKEVRLAGQYIQYEPLRNVRLPVNIFITIK
jgi:cytochrome P450